MVISIDWLTLHCSGTLPNSLGSLQDNALQGLLFELQQYGTRQFAKLYNVYIYEEGKQHLFAQIQSEPQSAIIDAKCILIKLANRYLYHEHGFDMFDTLISLLNLEIVRISRIDICGDFTQLLTGKPEDFIKDYASGIYRHVGRSVGATHFVQKGINAIWYTGLSFGNAESDTRVYMYNKSYELRTVKDKPYIRDKWEAAGIDTTRDVWRLEVSIKGKAFEYKDKSGGVQHITYKGIRNWGMVKMHYLNFVASLFSFIRYRDGIVNITREPRIELIEEIKSAGRYSIRKDITAGTTGDKIAIKRMWLSDMIYNGCIAEDSSITKTLAYDMAQSKDMGEWLKKSFRRWEKDYRPNE